MANRSRGKRNPDFKIPLLEEGQMPLFAIYARKSTDESSEKQSASIPQQIEKCMEYCQKEGIPLAPRPQNEPIEQLTIQEIENDNKGNKSRATELKAFYVQYWVITERKSARRPFERAAWRRIIEQQINQGKLQGLLGYAPDRFSRNLQEGGELIQLVERKILALKFTNFHFENNAAGQMMLGFWFVFAEHYSKKLSEDSLRGSEKAHIEGRAAGTRKYGYMIDPDDYFIPDPVHFPIMRKAFERKLFDGWSDAKIAEEMNSKGWRQTLKQEQGAKMTARKISENQLWSSKFYFGVYERTFNNVVASVDLRNMDTDNYKFEPVLSEEEWFVLQEKLSETSHAMIKKRKSMRTKKNDPIKPVPEGMLIDEQSRKCFVHQLPNPSRFEKKATTLNLRLENVVKPINIKYILPDSYSFSWPEIDKFLGSEFKKIKVSKEDYQAYLYALREKIENEYKLRNYEIQRLTILINREGSEQDKFFNDTNFGVGLNEAQKSSWDKKSKDFEKRINELENRKKLLREDMRDVILERQSFLSIIANLASQWEKATYVQKREILEIMCLNIIATPKKQLRIELKPEIKSMFIRDGGRGQN